MLAIVATGCSPVAPASAPPSASLGPATSAPVSPALATATSAPASSAAGPPLIQMAEHYFDPPQLTVAVGTTVLWRNVGVQTHDIHARDGSFDSPSLGPGGTFTFTFTKPGL